MLSYGAEPEEAAEPMKIIGITSTAILSLLLGIAGPAYAQHDQQGEKTDHAKSQETSHEQAKPQQQHAQQQPTHAQQQPTHAQQQPTHAQQQQRQEQNNQQQHAQQQRGNERPQPTQEQQRVEQSAWRQHSSQHWDSDHRNWQQRGGYHGYRIPDDRFRGYFGSNHGFRIYGLPFMVVGGYPRFQYEGYWISLMDPWPEYWGNDWYDNDDVYVAYTDNGYYMYNRRYPNVGIAISISM
jgi:Tfp pilus assembly protein PilE